MKECPAKRDDFGKSGENWKITVARAHLCVELFAARSFRVVMRARARVLIEARAAHDYEATD